ncbi:MAG: hypothetical protein IVW52_20105 [Acidimicrobiales bacterium]|nr:hypothetical protein [Acidimicrobiales bacterium]
MARPGTGAQSTEAELNRWAGLWITDRIHGRLHRGMGEVPAERFMIEAPMLQPLPRRRFDTAYVETRRVHVAIPRIEWRGVHYSVPPQCLGSDLGGEFGLDQLLAHQSCGFFDEVESLTGSECVE